MKRAVFGLCLSCILPGTACAEIVGIHEPLPSEKATGEGGGTTTTSSGSGGAVGAPEPGCANSNLDEGETDVDCGGNCPPCGPGARCQVNGDCTSRVCDPTTEQCQEPSCDDDVKNGNESDADCGGDVCLKCTEGQACEGEDANCVEALFCDGTVCAAKKPIGSACGGTSHCLNGFCTDGVCCNVLCAATCVACALEGSVGTCVAVPAGADPDDECPGVLACNGSGACQPGLNQGTACTLDGECGSGNCVDEVCCNTACAGPCKWCHKNGFVGICSDAPQSYPDPLCPDLTWCADNGTCQLLVNGQSCGSGESCKSSFCVDGKCCPNECDGLCMHCTGGDCSPTQAYTDPQDECEGANLCAGGACRLPEGEPCSVDGECILGNCVDGVCCDDECTGTCEACDLAGAVGDCTMVPAGQDPDNECGGGTPNCNGAGQCGP